MHHQKRRPTIGEYVVPVALRQLIYDSHVSRENVCVWVSVACISGLSSRAATRLIVRSMSEYRRASSERRESHTKLYD